MSVEVVEEVTILKGKDIGRKVELQAGLWFDYDIVDKKCLYDVLDNILPDTEKLLDKNIKKWEEGKHKIDVKQ